MPSYVVTVHFMFCLMYVVFFLGFVCFVGKRIVCVCEVSGVCLLVVCFFVIQMLLLVSSMQPVVYVWCLACCEFYLLDCDDVGV